MGSHENAAGFPSTWEQGKENPRAEYAGGFVYHKPGECLLAGGLLPE